MVTIEEQVKRLLRRIETDTTSWNAYTIKMNLLVEESEILIADSAVDPGISNPVFIPWVAPLFKILIIVCTSLPLTFSDV